MTDYDCTDNGIYVWRDTRRGGCPIGYDEIEELMSFAKTKKIKRIVYDNWEPVRYMENFLGILALVVSQMSFSQN